MAEHKHGPDWPPAVTKLCYFFIFSYTKLTCSSSSKFRFLFEITVSNLYTVMCQKVHLNTVDTNIKHRANCKIEMLQVNRACNLNNSL